MDRKEKKIRKEYELVDVNNCEMLKELNLYFIKLMKYLWQQPKVVALLLEKSDINDIREILAPFFVNNFYENILSSNYIEDNLMYLLTLILKQEINSLNDKNDINNFLNETVCGYLFEQLNMKSDVKAFFKKIISKIVENLELLYSSKEMHFEIKQIQEDITNAKESKKGDKSNQNKKVKISSNEILRNSITEKDLSFGLGDECEYFGSSNNNLKIDIKEFEEKYMKKLTKNEIIKLKESKNTSDVFCEMCIQNCERNEDIYSNEKLDDNIQSSKFFYNGLFEIYSNNVCRVITYIDQIFSNLFEHLYFAPYSIKCICKIISILLKKKFPDINQIEQNAFIAKFFFNKLFVPAFINPGTTALISDFIISGKTINNLKAISEILLKFVSGNLYLNNEKECDYTPFNWYFLNKMNVLTKLFDRMTKITLPNFIENFVYDKLPENFELNYFKEHPEEVFYHRSICFSLDVVCSIVSNLENCKKELFSSGENIGLKKTHEKLCSHSCTLKINEIKSKSGGKSIDNSSSFSGKKSLSDKKSKLRQKEYYFLLSDLLIDDKYKDIYNMEQKKKNFSLEELKTIQNETEITHNNIIKVKNCFSSLLYNYRLINKTDFEEGSTSDTISILKELSHYTKYSTNSIDATIPSQWFIDLILNNLKKIPETLTNNDCEELYNQMEKEINSSIKLLDFEALSLCHEKLRYAQRIKLFYEKVRKNVRKLDMNGKICEIIEKEPIPVELYFNEAEKFLKVEKGKIKSKDLLNLKDDDVIEDKKKRCILCKTIKIFTNEFPSIAKIQEMQDIDLIEFEKEINLTETLDNYFNIIKEYLLKNGKINEKYFETVNHKIYDYVMEKLYEKIFPIDDPKDNKIFRQAVMLSWIEPKHFIQDKKNYAFDSFLPDVTNSFKKIEKKKSPRKKLIYMSKIFESIRTLLLFNGASIMTGVDDQMPILNYAIIKARPMRMNSNCRFMELFLGDKRNKKEDNELTQLISLCDYIEYMSPGKLIGVSNEEFERKCNEAAKNEISSDYSSTTPNVDLEFM